MSCSTSSHSRSPRIASSPSHPKLASSPSYSLGVRGEGSSHAKNHVSAHDVHAAVDNAVDDDGWGLIGKQRLGHRTAEQTLNLSIKSPLPAAMPSSAYSSLAAISSYPSSEQTSNRTSRSGTSDASTATSTATSSSAGGMVSRSAGDAANDGGTNAAGAEGPKLLADLVEAILGAVLLDSGGDVVACWNAYKGLVQSSRRATEFS
jgi:hypothetical protein